jgi:hypothetical protein
MDDELDIIHIEQLFPSELESHEKQLFLAVILQALLDATKEKKENEKIRITYERDRAKSWLFAKVGVTCENFEEVCDMAGVNSSATRSFAYKVINSNQTKHVRKRIKIVLGEADE